MKKYLLTWYGITDLRAALGIEKGTGPILGALKSNAYDYVFILCYTNSEKDTKEQAVLQKQLEKDSGNPESDSPEVVDQFKFVDAFSNTEKGHRIFKKWLKAHLSEQNIETKVKTLTKKLSHLNDTRGIYDAVTKTLDLIYKDNGEKEVWAFISPGTSVMAFSWAFAALTNPELNIKILSAAEPRKPPEPVELPFELMASSSKVLLTKGSISETFDVIYHLMGDQRMPVLLGLKQFECKKHIFVNSKEGSVDIMKHFIPESAVSEEITTEPFNPAATKFSILKSIAENPKAKRIGFNLTGGTKLMYSGALAACRKVNGIPFYIETKQHNLVYLHNYEHVSLHGVDQVDDFFKINGFAVTKPGIWEYNKLHESRTGVTNLIWKNRSTIKKLYWDLAEHLKTTNNEEGVPFRLENSSVRASLDHKNKAFLKMSPCKPVTINDCPDFAKYLCGGWFEEYCYKRIEPLALSSKIRDLRINLEVTWNQSEFTGSYHEYPTQEFDIVFTDGRVLYIVECKAGNLKSEHIYKLQNNVRVYGGMVSKGIMLTALNPTNRIVSKRLSEARNLVSYSGQDIDTKLETFLRGILVE